MALPNKKNKAWDRVRLWSQIAGGIGAIGLCTLLVVQRQHSTLVVNRGPSAFSETFPSQENNKSELELLRSSGKLTAANEALISHAVETAAKNSSIPRALLYCLLFQESRLNHELGINSENGAIVGLGQFSNFSFYEINHQLDRFRPDNRALLTSVAGKDARPISADKKKLNAPSSYFYIPTAVAASAAYLNNRYYHLKALLDRQGLEYSEDVLWLYAALAYNKGTRSVLSIWNQVRRTRGEHALSLALTDVRAFRALSQERLLLTRSLKGIWPKAQAENYSKELSLHASNISSCALTAALSARAPEVAP